MLLCAQPMRSKLFTLTSNLWGHPGRQSSQLTISGTVRLLQRKIITIEWAGMPFWSLAARRSARRREASWRPASTRGRSWLLILLERWAVKMFCQIWSNRYKAINNNWSNGYWVSNNWSNWHWTSNNWFNGYKAFKKNWLKASKNKSQKGKAEDKAPSRLNPTRSFSLLMFDQHYYR